MFGKKKAGGDVWSREMGLPERRSYEEKLEASPVSKGVSALEDMEQGRRNKAYTALVAVIAAAALAVMVVAATSTCAATQGYIEDRGQTGSGGQEAEVADDGESASIEPTGYSAVEADGYAAPEGGASVPGDGSEGNGYASGAGAVDASAAHVNVSSAEVADLIPEACAEALPGDFATYCGLKGIDAQLGTLSVVSGTATVVGDGADFVATVADASGAAMYFTVHWDSDSGSFSYTTKEA